MLFQWSLVFEGWIHQGPRTETISSSSHNSRLNNRTQPNTTAQFIPLPLYQTEPHRSTLLYDFPLVPRPITLPMRKTADAKKKNSVNKRINVYHDKACTDHKWIQWSSRPSITRFQSKTSQHLCWCIPPFYSLYSAVYLVPTVFPTQDVQTVGANNLLRNLISHANLISCTLFKVCLI